MATGISSRRLLPALALAGVAALLAAGCGASSGGGATPTTAGHAAAGPFAWLKASAPPPGWKIARLPSGKAALAYPPGWRAIRTDPGTVSAALMGPHGRIRGYLNATPQQGDETLANWARFRPAHNGDEGDRNVVTDASARGLHFRTGSGSCVMDHYATVSAALMGSDHRIRGYLNATPQQGEETLANWARFRPAHNADEGDRNVVTDASARGLRFRTGSGSCVMDHYATVSAHYREIACLVRGSKASTVVVGAAVPRDWARLAPKIERAISSLAT